MFDKTFFLFALIATVFIGLIIEDGSVVLASNRSNQPIAEGTQQKFSHSGAYCGIYCLYAIMKLNGIEVEPNELLKPEYIGSYAGSSIAELKRVAEDFGLFAMPVGNLTTSDLRVIPYPVIIHVKSSAQAKTYNHYVLFLSAEDNTARLYDPPQPVCKMPFCELAPRWDGTGLVVSLKAISTKSVFGPARLRAAAYILIAVVFIFLTRWSMKRMPLSVGRKRLKGLLILSVVQCAGLVFFATLFGTIHHFFSAEGFLANPDGPAFIQKSHLAGFIPRVSRKKVRRLIETNAIFVDARFARDFEAGHLEGAFNIPVNADDVQRHRVMADVAKDIPIVVYCQNNGCRFAKKVAVELIEDGFSNVFLYEGNWQDLSATDVD